VTLPGHFCTAWVKGWCICPQWTSGKAEKSSWSAAQLARRARRIRKFQTTRVWLEAETHVIRRDQWPGGILQSLAERRAAVAAALHGWADVEMRLKVANAGPAAGCDVAEVMAVRRLVTTSQDDGNAAPFQDYADYLAEGLLRLLQDCDAPLDLEEIRGGRHGRPSLRPDPLARIQSPRSDAGRLGAAGGIPQAAPA
jgi:hypothetical protein